MKSIEMGSKSNLPEEIKAYEKEVKKTADSSLRKFLDKICGEDYALHDEDIIRYDADRENNLRELADYSDTYKEKLERTQNSSLVHSGYESRITGKGVYQISGLINGKKVKISNPADSDIFKGTVDGQEIPPEAAKQLWDKYISVANRRDDDLREIKPKKQRDHNQAVWEAGADERKKEREKEDAKRKKEEGLNPERE